MRTLPAVGLTVMLMVSGAGGKQTNKPDLKLTAALDMAAPEQQPILVIHMLNQSGHLLRCFRPLASSRYRIERRCRAPL